jgi:hypothetical protein
MPSKMARTPGGFGRSWLLVRWVGGSDDPRHPARRIVCKLVLLDQRFQRAAPTSMTELGAPKVEGNAHDPVRIRSPGSRRRPESCQLAFGGHLRRCSRRQLCCVRPKLTILRLDVGGRFNVRQTLTLGCWTQWAAARPTRSTGRIVPWSLKCSLGYNWSRDRNPPSKEVER